MTLIELKDVSFSYPSGAAAALSGLSLSLEAGSFVAVMGANGSGKSTFAKLLNALEKPSSGSVLINGIPTSDSSSVAQIRRTVGLVFQNPDSQIIGSTVEEDVAFGPENLGLEPAQIRKRADAALKAVGLCGLEEENPSSLSGGQKQLLAVAGVLAMDVSCIVLDEATSMMDNCGRARLLSVLKRLNEEKNLAVILITHDPDEAALADRIIVLDRGTVSMDGKAAVVLSRVCRLRELGLKSTTAATVAYELRNRGIGLKEDIVSSEDLVCALERRSC
ncbi:MAG: energy-coupling factor transporter ATPase [Spirochaetales bacterium]|nr:energy-coupling factor transporter ATPase [Spirochaetales bacterium]